MLFREWQRIVNEYLRQLNALYGSRIGAETTAADLLQLAADPIVEKRSRQIAKHITRTLHESNAKSWREAAAKSGRPYLLLRARQAELRGDLGHALAKLIEQNANQIRSVPFEIARRINSFVASEQRRGIRASEIKQSLREQLPDLKASRLRLIARTEVSSGETALTRARSESLGIDWYQWQTSRDQRVRAAHRAMNGVLVAWASAPSPEKLIGEPSTLGHYHAGSCPNCRCLALQLVSLDEVSWPRKVYRNNEIQMLTRAQFSRIVELPKAA